MRRQSLRTANHIVGLFVATQAYDDGLTDDLVATATRTSDDDVQWACIRVLQERGGPHVFAAAVTLCNADAPRDREVGVAILGQNLVEEKTLCIAALPVLSSVAAREHDVGVVVTLCGALAGSDDVGATDLFSR